MPLTANDNTERKQLEDLPTSGTLTTLSQRKQMNVVLGALMYVRALMIVGLYVADEAQTSPTAAEALAIAGPIL